MFFLLIDLRSFTLNKMRYFFFAYVYSVTITTSQKAAGSGSFACSSQSFPSRQSLKTIVKNMVTEYESSNVEVEVTITNWIEMTE